MKRSAGILSCLALVGTIAPPVLFFAGGVTLEEMKLWMLMSTLAWFASAPFWMDRRAGS